MDYMPQSKDTVAEQIKKQNPYTFCLQETHFRSKERPRLKVRVWKKVFHANGNQSKSNMYIRQNRL